MRVLVCGGRDFTDAALVDKVLSRAHARRPIAAIIQGGARGADQLAAEWARNHQVPVETFNADWKTYGKGAGMIRNQRMLDDAAPDYVVALPGGRGTADMVARARNALGEGRVYAVHQTV